MDRILPSRAWVRSGHGGRTRSSNVRGHVHGGGNAPGFSYSPYHGFHADSSKVISSVDLLRVPFAACDVIPPTDANGAMALFYHSNISHYSTFKPQRDLSRAYNFEVPTVIFTYFTAESPGTNTTEENDAAMAWLATQVAAYGAEIIIAAWANMNASNFMVGAPDATRNAAAWALEGRAITEVFMPAGVRWCANDDIGIVALANNIVARRAAWALAGADPNDCEFMCCHVYVDSGWVPSHHPMAQLSFARVNVPTTIRLSECGYGFIGAGQSRGDKPWLFQDLPFVEGEAHPQALTWTRLVHEWARTQQVRMNFFDAPMWLESESLDLSVLGQIYASDQHNQPELVLPIAGTLWAGADAATKAGAIMLSNDGDPGYAADVAAWVQAGNYFTLP